MAEKKVDTLTAGRDKNLEIAISQIEKQFGKGSIMRMGDSKTALGDVPVVSTGSLGLYIALGIGGLPAGRIVEIYGPESSGKTTLCLHVIANAQAKGGNCAIIDAEHAIDPGYAASIGVKVDELLISQPDCGEDALNIADTLVRSNSIDVLVIDSVAALVPKAEIEGQMGDSHVGLQARLMHKNHHAHRNDGWNDEACHRGTKRCSDKTHTRLPRNHQCCNAPTCSARQLHAVH